MRFLSRMHWHFINNQLYFSYMGRILLNLFAGLQLWPHKFRAVSAGHIHSTLNKTVFVVGRQRSNCEEFV